MPENDTPVQRKRLGKIVSLAIPIAALLTGLLVINETDRYPRTDDAEVFANFIGIAPQVDGPLIALPVQDNQFVKQGGLLFEIDPRPYEYALAEGAIRSEHAGGPDRRREPDDRLAAERRRGGGGLHDQRLGCGRTRRRRP